MNSFKQISYGFKDQIPSQKLVDDFLNILTSLDSTAGNGIGYQLVGTDLPNSLNEIITAYELGILVSGLHNESIKGYEVIAFRQKDGAIISSASSIPQGKDYELVPRFVYPNDFMFEKNVSLPGVDICERLTNYIIGEIGIQRFPMLKVGNRTEFTIQTHRPPGVRPDRYIKVLQNDVVRVILELDDKELPSIVYPMLWESKPNIIPNVAFSVMETLYQINMTNMDVLDLGTGDFAFYSLYAIHHGARSCTAIEKDPERRKKHKKLSNGLTVQ